MADILAVKGLTVERQVMIPIQFSGKIYDEAFRADIIVEKRIIVEIKSVDRLAPIHKKQVLTYLNLSGLTVGLLINFGGEYLKVTSNGYPRLVLPAFQLLPSFLSSLLWSLSFRRSR